MRCWQETLLLVRDSELFYWWDGLESRTQVVESAIKNHHWRHLGSADPKGKAGARVESARNFEQRTEPSDIWS